MVPASYMRGWALVRQSPSFRLVDQWAQNMLFDIQGAITHAVIREGVTVRTKFMHQFEPLNETDLTVPHPAGPVTVVTGPPTLALHQLHVHCNGTDIAIVNVTADAVAEQRVALGNTTYNNATCVVNDGAVVNIPNPNHKVTVPPPPTMPDDGSAYDMVNSTTCVVPVGPYSFFQQLVWTWGVCELVVPKHTGVVITCEDLARGDIPPHVDRVPPLPGTAPYWEQVTTPRCFRNLFGRVQELLTDVDVVMARIPVAKLSRWDRAIAQAERKHGLGTAPTVGNNQLEDKGVTALSSSSRIAVMLLPELSSSGSTAVWAVFVTWIGHAAFGLWWIVKGDAGFRCGGP